MRIITKPTTTKCNIQAYIRYLLSEPVRTSCTGLSDVLLNNVSST
ncbi:hypothetical protein Psal006b_03167 [Piscirickettsia salmonis]|uniref:Transposase n=1 Tax=Piscirickettsia salmonis TaxID=1238 RepID=A0AAC8VF90_PISSA|nr:hypothetical protein [Piscirickettsia salmonis]ALB21251.1 transposase [Piscirickettsia salmonis]QGO00130.1 hypothetical protein Psal006b_03167 [Piscirickettsia salmonis]QGO03780.1 hypothetical protein Psal008_03197 [Piscirickettsia salmonis]QGO14405.1 hypothetical protein Psal010b_03159 [Piscirickettsia salmonis]QGO21506.1 hypothetical protein Psal013_03202 [Piscirickettsia salmonis]